jgi:hypothetical protein
MPEPFPASITPRSKEREAIVIKEWRLQEDLLDSEKQWFNSPVEKGV